MATNFEMVQAFMLAFGQDVKYKPEMASDAVRKLRVALIDEECDEVADAMYNKSIDQIAKELTDLLVVTYGAGAAYGIDLDACFAEVHRSNMSKLGEDGRPIYREDGKIMKGPNYREADLKDIMMNI